MLLNILYHCNGLRKLDDNTQVVLTSHSPNQPRNIQWTHQNKKKPTRKPSFRERIFIPQKHFDPYPPFQYPPNLWSDVAASSKQDQDYIYIRSTTKRSQCSCSCEKTHKTTRRSTKKYESSRKEEQPTTTTRQHRTRRSTINLLPTGKHRKKRKTVDFRPLPLNKHTLPANVQTEVNATTSGKLVTKCTAKSLPKLDPSYVPTSDETVEIDASKIIESGELISVNNHYLPPDRGSTPAHYIDDV